MHRKRVSWVALVGIGLAGIVAVRAATAPAARSEPSAFELTVEGTWEWNVYWGPFQEGTGTFRSRAPFCATGTFVEDPYVGGATTWRLTCADGTGGLTLSVFDEFVFRWQIVDGSGSYAGLRGGGSLRSGEALGNPTYAPGSLVTWRGTLVGVVDWGSEPDQPGDGDTVAPTNADTVAPTIAIASARAAKLRRPAGAYSIKVALALRDDVEGNTVAYMLRVTQTRAHRLIVLASEEGTTASGSVSTTLRVVPDKRVRSVQLRLSGSDPNGNAGMSIVRSVKLPR
ncbi:MAG: hypothetical protein L0206_18460 [Actinobacteria bacterium]|nr:hypothetical protein [Actinomycetota bacterium]